MDEMVQREGPEEFAQAWLQHHGYAEEAAACRNGGSPSPLVS